MHKHIEWKYIQLAQRFECSWLKVISVKATKLCAQTLSIFIMFCTSRTLRCLVCYNTASFVRQSCAKTTQDKPLFFGTHNGILKMPQKCRASSPIFVSNVCLGTHCHPKHPKQQDFINNYKMRHKFPLIYTLKNTSIELSRSNPPTWTQRREIRIIQIWDPIQQHDPIWYSKRYFNQIIAYELRKKYSKLRIFHRWLAWKIHEKKLNYIRVFGLVQRD